MDAENLNPLDELKRLDTEIASATELAALKPIYFRLNEIGQQYFADFDVQFAVSEAKQHLMDRGNQLKQREAPAALPPKPAPPPPPAPFPYIATAVPEPPAAPEPLPPALVPPIEQAPPPVLPPAPPPSARKFNPALVLIPAAALGLAVLLGVFLVNLKGKRKASVPPPAGAVQVEVATNPTGASVRVAGGNSEATCVSNCKLALSPGTYQVTAFLDGFEPAASSVSVTAAGQPGAVSLTLQPQAQTVRILTDLDQGKVVLDGQPPVDLQEGQLVLDRVPSGSHSVKISGRNGDASFSFAVADARMPAVAGPVTARNLIAVLVSSFGKQARVVASAGPLKLAVNGQAQGQVGPDGTDLTNFQPGVAEIVVGEGRDQRNMSETFGAAPMLTAFLKSDVNAGTLVVSTGQDDVRVFLNDKEYRRRTQRGQLRIQTIGRVTVRVAKGGFQEAPPQTAEVAKGAEVRLRFELQPQPQFGSLEIRGGTPGAEVLLDQKSVGVVGPDGSFAFNTIQPGERTVELRLQRHTPKRVLHGFQAGQTAVLTGADVVLAAATGTIRLGRTPASATISYRRADETESHEARGNQIELPAGSYVFSATAPGFAESIARVQLSGGESRAVEFTLARERPAAPAAAPAPVVAGMADFLDAPAWRREGSTWVHKGGGFVPYKLPPKGVFTFTVELLKGGGIFRSGQIRWCLQYLDARNYLLFEMDRKNFSSDVVQKGRKTERIKTRHDFEGQKAFALQIEVTPDRLVHKVRAGDEWTVLDTFSEPGRDFTQGKFGFMIQGNDEIAISDFKFVAK